MDFRLGPDWPRQNCQEEHVDKSNLATEIIPVPSEVQSDSSDSGSAVKKPFVTPEISVPVDVLEATTFFQGIDSGSTT